MKTSLTRRTFLRGVLGGASLSLGLPAFEAFLNANGTAWADGAPLPLRFGTWFWGCGMNPSRWNPTSAGLGPDWELTTELAPVAPIREHLNGDVPATGWKSKYDWKGFIPFDDLPQSYNPSAGRIVNANHPTVTNTYPYHLGHGGTPGYRARRIQRVCQAC